MYTLLCIDLQPTFNVCHNSRIVNNAEREVRQAIRDKAHILFLEYHNCGDTVDQLTKITDRYSKVHYLEKNHDNGVLEIMKAIRDYDLPIQHIKVCGVNTDVCVYFTVHGLNARLPHSNIEIIADACDSQFGIDDHLRGLDHMRKLGCTIFN